MPSAVGIERGMDESNEKERTVKLTFGSSSKKARIIAGLYCEATTRLASGRLFFWANPDLRREALSIAPGPPIDSIHSRTRYSEFNVFVACLDRIWDHFLFRLR